VELIGVEAAGAGLETRRHSAPLTTGARGVLHGAMSAVLQDEEGQILVAHSISAGLDYPGVGPEHAYLRDSGRATYVAASDEEALAAFKRVAELEGILPALEPSHAVAWVLANPSAARSVERPSLDLITLSGRGDKDLAEVLALDS
jgi:tryptophan synthase beta chain